MTTQLTKTALAALLALTLWNCSTTDPEPMPYESGVYVINSGNFFDNNGSISYLPRTGDRSATDIFKAANPDRPLGLQGGVQDYTEIDGKGVILVDNSTAGQDKIEIVSSGTFKLLKTLGAPDVENPRFVVKAGNNKAYVTCYGSTGSTPYFISPGYMLVIDLAAQTITKKIPMPMGINRMVVIGNEVYAGSDAGDPTLVIVNTDTDELKQPAITVGANTNPVAADANNQLWAYSGATKEMVRVNPSTKAIATRLKVGGSPKSPGSFAISADRKTFYFVNSFYDAADNYKEKGETYRFNIEATSIPAATPFINRLFYGLGVDPQTGTLYAGVSPSLKQTGYVLRYNADTGALIDSVRAEIGPTRFFFR